MENETELIRQQMLETRTALSDKLEALQGQVLATVEGTTQSVTDTVQTVQEAVQETVSAVSDTVQGTVDSVKRTFDVNEHVQNHPWLAVGGAVAVGFVGGRMLDGLLDSGSRGPAFNGYASPAPAAASHAGNGHAARSEPGLLDSLAGPLVKQIREMALGVLAGVAKDMVKTHAPDNLKPHLNEMADNLSQALGVKPIQGLVPTELPAEKKPEQSRPVCA